jgi:L-threonylcarbamoyladenylate synthase
MIMTYLKLKTTVFEPAIIRRITGSLKNGQVVVLPADTIYGLSCRADDPRALRRIYKMKRRDPQKPLIVLVASLAMAKKYAVISRRQEEFLRKIWLTGTRPTTVILKSSGRLSKESGGSAKSLALRLPKDRFLIKILKAVGNPLVSTSLNLSGRPNITDLKNLADYFPKKLEQPDLVVDRGISRRRPSKLIDFRDESHPLILRR